ncbi:MAG: phospho-N-acetylmuramoyl-pentapeptide-transferase, partial [Saprospiraceae bacterium]|nr:phospho-N-acetylmuramoyl-pentapeptide-transferase [Saprospiraceae bacterium]
MLYYLFDYLEQQYNFPGAGVFQYLSFRSAMAIILALIISMIIGRGIIKRLRRLQVGEDIRDLGLEGQLE